MFLILLLTLTITTHTIDAYFTYSDCLPRCRDRPHCIITRIAMSNFNTQCINNADDCEIKASDDVACISSDTPTMGGSLIWPDFEKNKPLPPSPDLRDCYSKAWMITSIIQSILSAISVTALITIKALIAHRRRSYEQITNRTEQHPYQDTVEEIREDVE